MTLAATGPGLLYPLGNGSITGGGGTTLVMDAASERAAMIGHIFWNGRPGSAKTVSSAGGSISIRFGTTTFANASTSLDIGIQDVATATGPTARPDDSFDVKATYVGGTDTINSGAWTTIAMETGTKSITHGDLIAIVMDMTARGGADSVAWYTVSHSRPGRPLNNQYLAGAWLATSTSDMPIAYITADDGTLGVIYGHFLPAVFQSSSESFNDGTDPDERGMVFQIPWDCKIDSFWALTTGNGTAADFTVSLYSSPTTSATLVTSVSVLGEQVNAWDTNNFSVVLPTEVSLSKDTDYCLAFKASGATSIGLSKLILPAAGLRAFFPGGTTIAKATRNNSTGNFTTDTSNLYMMGVGISQLHDTGGGSGGGTRVIGS